jgi:hypothetical protein
MCARADFFMGSATAGERVKPHTAVILKRAYVLRAFPFCHPSSSQALAQSLTQMQSMERRFLTKLVMPGLVPGIHVLASPMQIDEQARA